MLSITFGDRLRLGHSLIDGTQDNTVWRFLDEHRSTAFKPQTFTNANRKAHAAVGRDVNLESHRAISGASGTTV